MTDEDRPRFGIAMATAGATWNREITQVVAQAYWMSLADLGISQVERAIAAAMRRCRFMPTPAEIRELAVGPPLTAGDRAIRAWAAFERAVSREGAYHTVSFDDPVINATIRSLGGWIAICEQREGKWNPFLRKDFIQTYEALCRTGVSGDLAGPLVGLFELDNRLHGYNVDRPVLIESGLPPHSCEVVSIPAPPPVVGALACEIGGMPRSGANTNRWISSPLGNFDESR